jgi:hypothetical protein
MTVEVVEKLVPKRVSVTRCDGPGCIKEVTGDEYSHGGAKGWFQLSENQPPSRGSFEGERLVREGLIKDHLIETVHFHNWRCFVAWALHHQMAPYQVNTPEVVTNETTDG